MSNPELNLNFSGDVPINGAPESQAKQKKPWLAAVLSFIWPGLGQIYAARPLRGIAISLLLALVNLTLFQTKAFQIPVGFLAFLVVGIPLLCAIAIDAARQATRQNASPMPNAGWTAKNISAAVVILAANAFSARNGLPATSKPFKVPSASMCPTICEGERIIADMDAYKRNPPRPGDLVMLNTKFDNSLYIKRVIAAGGDIVKQGKLGEILVNGHPLPPLTICSKPPTPTSEGMTINFDPVTVPAGSFFVVGDNLANSLDSRTLEFGFVSVDQMRGRPLYLYWSPVLSRIGCKLR